MSGNDDLAQVSTLDGPGVVRRSPDGGPPRVPALTILSHPDPVRAGELARLPGLAAPAGFMLLSRMEPELGHPGGSSRAPLADAVLSRRPMRIEAVGGGRLALMPAAGGSAVLVDGEPLAGRRVVERAALEQGVVIEIAARVVLLLHLVGPPRDRGPSFGIVGESDAVGELRAQIQRVAEVPVPVLIRGESGTGKDLVARALHQASARAAGPYVAVNMAAIPPSVAASELFGHARGAFTGATGDQRGYFGQASGGTLFLDEVGETPAEVQSMLLRALETSEIQPLGTAGTRKVDVRLVAATDADLEQAADARTFRAPLLHRLSSYVITVAPLRERRDDFGRLFLYFLRAELESVGELERLRPPAAGVKPFIPAPLVARLARHGWPGNVRQLRNACRQLVISSRGEAELRLDATLEKMLATVSEPAVAPHPEAARRVLGEIGDEELVACLQRHGWKTSAAAAELGISRTSLYALIDKSDRVRKARDVSAEEILACRGEHGSLDSLAEALRVSKRGLRLRMRELGIPSTDVG